MNSDDLRLFAHIVRVGSISRAALETGVDQSTLSRRLAALEAELGVRLLHRSGRGVVPTDRGARLLDYAKAVAGLLDEALAATQEGVDGGPAQLHVAAQPTIASMLFGPLGKALGARYPRTRLRFVEGLADQLLEKLAKGELDLAILYLPEHAGALQFDLLLSEGVRLIAPADYPAPGGEIATGRLRDIPLILPSTHHGLRLMAESLAARHGFAVNVALECDGSTGIMKRLVQQGCGCTLLPLAAVIDEVAAGRLKSYRLLEPEVRRRVGLVMGRNRVLPAGLWDAVRLVKAQVNGLVVSGEWPDTVLETAAAPAGDASSA